MSRATCYCYPIFLSYVEGSSGGPHFKENGVAWQALSDQEQEDYSKRATLQNEMRAIDPKRQWQDAMDDVLEDVSLFSSSIVFTSGMPTLCGNHR